MSNDHKMSATLLDSVTRCRLHFGDASRCAQMRRVRVTGPRRAPLTQSRSPRTCKIKTLRVVADSFPLHVYMRGRATRETRSTMLTRHRPIWWEHPRHTNSHARAARQCCDRTRPVSAGQAGPYSASRWRFRPILLQLGTFGGSPRQIGRPWWQPPRPCVRLRLRSLRRPTHEKNRQRNAPG